MGENLKKGSSQTKLARVKLKDLESHERKRLNLFRYPTHDIGAYLGRGAPVNALHCNVVNGDLPSATLMACACKYVLYLATHPE